MISERMDGASVDNELAVVRGTKAEPNCKDSL